MSAMAGVIAVTPPSGIAYGARGFTVRSRYECELLRSVRVARMRRMRDSVPGQRFGQCVLERGRLEAELLSSPIQNVARGPLWIPSVRTRSLWQLIEGDWIHALGLAQCTRDAFDQVPQAHPFEPGVVCLARQVFTRVAGERARVADVLHPRQARLPLV